MFEFGVLQRAKSNGEKTYRYSFKTLLVKNTLHFRVQFVHWLRRKRAKGKEQGIRLDDVSHSLTFNLFAFKPADGLYRVLFTRFFNYLLLM